MEKSRLNFDMHDVWIKCPDTHNNDVVKKFVEQMQRIIRMGSVSSGIALPEMKIYYVSQKVGLKFYSEKARDKFWKNVSCYLRLDSSTADQLHLKVDFAISARWCISKRTIDLVACLAQKHTTSQWLTVLEAKQLLLDDMQSGLWQYGEKKIIVLPPCVEKKKTPSSKRNYTTKESSSEVSVRVSHLEKGILYNLSDEQQEKIRKGTKIIQQNGCLRKFLYEHGVRIITRKNDESGVDVSKKILFHFYTTDVEKTSQLLQNLDIEYDRSPKNDSFILYNNIPKKIDRSMDDYYMKNAKVHLFPFKKNIPEESAFPVGGKNKTRVSTRHMRS